MTNAAVCRLGGTGFAFLWLIATDATPVADKVSTSWPYMVPRSYRKSRRFTGLLSFCRCFISNFADETASRHAPCEELNKRSCLLGPLCSHSNYFKHAISIVEVLTHPKSSIPIPPGTANLEASVELMRRQYSDDSLWRLCKTLKPAEF